MNGGASVGDRVMGEKGDDGRILRVSQKLTLRIRGAILSAGVPVNAIALQCGVSRQALDRVLSGGTQPSLALTERLLDVLGLPWAVLDANATLPGPGRPIRPPAGVVDLTGRSRFVAGGAEITEDCPPITRETEITDQFRAGGASPAPRKRGRPRGSTKARPEPAKAEPAKATAAGQAVKFRAVKRAAKAAPVKRRGR